MSSFVGVAELNWRWAFWIALIFAGVSLALLLLLPETYGPVILRHRAEKLRKEKKDENIFAPIELESQEWRELMKVILVLPLQLLFLKPVVTAVCGYMALEFGVFYLFFEAYPIIFQGTWAVDHHCRRKLANDAHRYIWHEYWPGFIGIHSQ
jgi:MFS family permease